MPFLITVPTSDQIAAMSRQDYRVLENKVRRALERQEFRLSRNRRRDPRASDYGLYTVTDPLLGPIDKPMTLIEVIEWLNAGVPAEALSPTTPRITNGAAIVLHRVLDYLGEVQEILEEHIPGIDIDILRAKLWGIRELLEPDQVASA